MSFTRDSRSAPWRSTRPRAGTRPAAPPFRADHVGRLLQPPKLLNARTLYERRVITIEALQEFEDAAIQHAVKYQENLGLRGITDGGFRQRHLQLDLAALLGEAQPEGAISRDPAGRGSLVVRRDYLFLKAVARGLPKMIIPSPTMLRGGEELDIGVPADPQQVDTELAAVYAKELALLAHAGCSYVQFDDGVLATLCDERGRAAVRQRGEDPDRLLQRHVRLINAAIATRPSNMSVCLYLWRESFRESWVADRVCEEAVEMLFGGLQVDGFFLGHPEARARDFALLRHVPPGRKVVLGLVGIKSGHLQHKHDLKRTIDIAAKYLPLEQLCLSPHCGFSSMDHGRYVGLDVQTAKLRLVVETARDVWGEA